MAKIRQSVDQASAVAVNVKPFLWRWDCGAIFSNWVCPGHVSLDVA